MIHLLAQQGQQSGKALDAGEIITFAVLGVVVALILFQIMVFIAKRFLYVCAPNEILVFSGRKYKNPDGSHSGYRVVFGGRSWKRPFIERVDQMDLNSLPLEVSVSNAYSQGGIPLKVQAIANVKVSSDPLLVLNAVERFLGRDMMEIRQVARETLEGTLRGIVATMTPEELNEDRLAFAERISSEADSDLGKLGIQLDTLKIQAVSDEVNYLDSIGRADISRVIKAAAIAESDADREANMVAADQLAQAEVAGARAEKAIVERMNALRALEAELLAQVEAEQLKAEAAAQEARSIAEQELQEIRKEVEKTRLQSDVVIPAEARRESKEMEAKAKAAPIDAEGAAVAESLQMLANAWKDAGPDATQIYLINKIEVLADLVAQAVQNVEIGEINLIDSGEGTALPNLMQAFPESMTRLLASLQGSMGVDIASVLNAPKPSAEETAGG
jgi:flotillin